MKSPRTMRVGDNINSKGGTILLPAKIQFFDQLTILRAVLRTQVIQKPAAVADQLEQSLSRAEVFAMRFEMRGELADAFGEKSDLHGGATGVCGVHLEPFDRFLFDFFG